MATVTPIKAIDEAILPFPPTEVWRVLADIAAYPNWWPRRLGLRVLHCEPGLVGSEVEERPLGGRPFRCRVEGVEEPFRIRTRYYGGFIEGRGEFQLESAGSGTRVRYELDVSAEGWTVACLSWILPLGRLHSRLMQGVFRQLERAVAQRKAGSSPRKEDGSAL
jgi:uncharacterized protein YndB with AHSA1/START domain